MEEKIKSKGMQIIQAFNKTTTRKTIMGWYTWMKIQKQHKILEVYVKDNKYSTYLKKHLLEYEGAVCMWEDYEIEIPKPNDHHSVYTTNKLRQLKLLGNRLHETQQELQQVRKEQKNKWIKIVTEEIRTNVRKNRSRLVWKRLNQLKEQEGNAKQRNMELKDANGKVINTPAGILRKMREHIRKEHYKTPSQLECITISPELWKNSHAQACEHIHPNILKRRKQSKLQKYIAEQGGETEQYLINKISTSEIKQAISQLSNRKSVGKDGITAEVVKENEEWITPMIEIILHNCQITHSMPKQWLHGVMAFIPKGKKDKSSLNNFRPITLIQIIYKIWAIILTNRITPYMSLLTNETQTAYKTGRSTIDILSLIQNQIQNEKTKQLLLIDLSKAFDSIDRDILWTTLYEKGLPWDLIKQIRSGHCGNYLAPKYKGKIGGKINNNKGVFQGSPISPLLFIIYFAHVLENYEEKLVKNYKIERPLITTRNDRAESAWCHQHELKRFRQKGDRKIKNPPLSEVWTQEKPNDMHVFADDLTIKTTDAHEIYPKLKIFEECAKARDIHINWDKILIITDEKTYATYEVAKRLPERFKKIRFVTHGTLLGQQINMQGKTNQAIQARLNKAKGAWKIIKHRIFLDNQIKKKNRFDLWNAAIGSILKYGLTTLRSTEMMDRKIQQFTSRCMNEIIYAAEKEKDENENYQTRDTNEYNRTKYCLPTIHSQLQKEKVCDIYRWKTTLSPAYLNNKQDMENEMRLWEFNWYRMKDIMTKHHDEEPLSNEEIQLMGDYQSMCKPERWRELEQRIRTQEPPRTNVQLRKIAYHSFKELAKLVLRYQTYYPEKYIPKHDKPNICPTCGIRCNGKSQLTKHRKNTETCKEAYWNDINQMKKCTNQNCDRTFLTEKDLEYHMRYHCGNELNPFRNYTQEWHIDRRTLYGYGIHPEDIRLFHDKIFFDRLSMTWNCLECGYQRDKYEWRQVYGHVRSTHCYKSREQNERWNIPMDIQPPVQKSANQKKITAIQFEQQTQRIYQDEDIDDGLKWVCSRCGEKYEEDDPIIGHLGKKHPETTTGSTECPYCPLTFSNIANLKIHIREQRCPNRRGEITPQTWTDIVNLNPKSLDEPNASRYTERNPNRQRRPKRPKPPQIPVDLLMGRISQTEQQTWRCEICQKTKPTLPSIKSHLSFMHCETNAKDVYCPYCNKYCKHMGNLKQHIMTKKCLPTTKNEINHITWNDIVQRNKKTDGE